MFGNLFISNLESDPAFFFATVITVVISITLHELAHGFVAIRLGDDTPARTGHMTLNPIVHMGGLALVLLAIAGIAFGQMPVDRTRLRGKYAESFMAAAGPATNLLLSLLTLSALGLWERFDHTPYADWSPVTANGKYLLLVFGSTNVILAIFNLLPVPPLDGSWIVANLFPPYRKFLDNDVTRGVMAALFFALFLGAGVLVTNVAYTGSMRYLTAVSGQGEDHFAVIGARDTIEHPEYFRTDDDTNADSQTP